MLHSALSSVFPGLSVAAVVCGVLLAPVILFVPRSAHFGCSVLLFWWLRLFWSLWLVSGWSGCCGYAGYAACSGCVVVLAALVVPVVPVVPLSLTRLVFVTQVVPVASAAPVFSVQFGSLVPVSPIVLCSFCSVVFGSSLVVRLSLVALFFPCRLHEGAMFESSISLLCWLLHVCVVVHHHHLHECFKSSFLVGCWWVRGSSPLSLLCWLWHTCV